MRLWGIGKMLTRQAEQENQSEMLQAEGKKFKLASDGGYIVALKYALFCLFAFYNARLFLTTVPGWEAYMTAAFALLGEATALYCFNNYTRSTGNHGDIRPGAVHLQLHARNHQLFPNGARGDVGADSFLL
ncbi:MAG: hypothetical protein ABI977_02135 [Acidobacteriota bacterium]